MYVIMPIETCLVFKSLPKWNYKADLLVNNYLAVEFLDRLGIFDRKNAKVREALEKQKQRLSGAQGILVYETKRLD